MILAGGLLLGYLSLRQRSSFKVNAKQMLSLTLLAIFGYYLTNACEFWSLQHLSAAKTCFIYGLSPFFAAFFSYLHFGEKMNRRKWLGLGVGVLGILPILALQTGSEDLIGGFLIFSWPEIAMIAAVLCSVYGWVLLRLVVKDSILPLMANGTSMLIGGALALIHSYLVEPWTPIPVVQGGLPSFIQGTLIDLYFEHPLDKPLRPHAQAFYSHFPIFCRVAQSDFRLFQQLVIFKRTAIAVDFPIDGSAPGGTLARLQCRTQAGLYPSKNRFRGSLTKSVPSRPSQRTS